MNVPSKCNLNTQEREAKDQGKICCHLKATNQQGSGAGSMRGNKKAQLHQELRTLNREMEALIKRRLDQGFQTRKSFNSQMFIERKMKGSTGHKKAFHAVRYPGMSHSLIFDDAALDPCSFLHPEKSLHR